MNDRTRYPWLTPLVALTGALAGIASAAGVFLRGDLATREFVTARGDIVEILIGGVYRFNGLQFASEGVGWDIVTLFLVVPALALTLPSLLRGTLRATLFSAGILVYFLYQYFEYAVALAYGPFFALYVAIIALSVSGTALLLARVDVATLPERFGPRFPRRAMIAFGLYMALLLGGMWLPLIARTFNADAVAELYGGTTLVVQAFDLGILVPVGLFTAVTVYRRLPVGHLLSAVVIVKGMSVSAGIVAMLVVEGWTTGDMQLPPIAIFALTALAGAAIAWRMYRGLDATVRSTTAPGGSTVPRAVASN